MKVAELFGHRTDHPLSITKDFVAGLECEIESVRSKKGIGRFVPTDDGSLRNEGVEFISEPLGRETLVQEFSNLHATITYYDKSQAFSPRTSTHVHVNCRSLDEKQVRTVVLLYALYEEFFFCMVEPSRRGNIHCVPLTETFLCNYYGYNLNNMIQRWHKYTALNLIPLGKLGTIEFRHLQGTDDTNLMESWLTALENLWQLGQTVEINEANLSSETVLREWFGKIFGHSSRIMALEPCLFDMINNSLIDVKLSLV